MSSDIISYDFIIIGTGSGLSLANGLASEGFDVAIIEKDKPGGTCLNTGCIPSKFLIHSSDVMEKIRHANDFGINITDMAIDAAKIFARANDFADSESDKLLDGLSDQTNPKFYHTTGKFLDKKLIQVRDKKITAKNIVIACGSRPKIPNIDGLDNCDFLTNVEALRLQKIPKSMVIIGGGYIGCEFAHFFGSLGTKITIIHSHENLLNHEDEEISVKFTKLMKKKFNVYLDYDSKKITKKNNEYITTAHSDSGNVLEVSSEQILVTVGRIPNTDRLELDKTGVKLDDKGHVVVNEYLESSERGIFALGDVLEKYPFKHAANHEAQCLYNILNGNKVSIDYSAMPRAIFTSPQIASVGKTEQELRSQKINYDKFSQSFDGSAMGAIIKDDSGFVKLLVDKHHEKILGAHILGTDASILIHEIIVAMNSEKPIDVLKKSIHIHPALSEVVSKTVNQIS